MKIFINILRRDVNLYNFRKRFKRSEWNKAIIKIIRTSLNGKVAQMPVDPNSNEAINTTSVIVNLPDSLVEKYLVSKGIKETELASRVKDEIYQCIRVNQYEALMKKVPASDIERLFPQFLNRIHKCTTYQQQQKAFDMLIRKISKF